MDYLTRVAASATAVVVAAYDAEAPILWRS